MRYLVCAALVCAPLAGGCSAPATSVAYAADEPAISTEEVEAQRACGDLTGYSANGATTATDAARAREYAACVATVLKRDGAPALRGRS